MASRRLTWILMIVFLILFWGFVIFGCSQKITPVESDKPGKPRYNHWAEPYQMQTLDTLKHK